MNTQEREEKKTNKGKNTWRGRCKKYQQIKIQAKNK